MNTTNTATVITENLNPVLNSAAIFPLAQCSDKKLNAGHRFTKLIKKGESSKLPESCAVEVPALSLSVFNEYLKQPAIQQYLMAATEKLQDAAVKAQIEAGHKVIQYSELSAENIAAYCMSSANEGGIGQLSEERIANWFDSTARDLYMVALADRLGVSDTATEADVKRLEQIANQTRDNLKKLSSKKPVHFDPRVKAALNWALEVTMQDDDVMNSRLVDKLNMEIKQDDLVASLGF